MKKNKKKKHSKKKIIIIIIAALLLIAAVVATVLVLNNGKKTKEKPVEKKIEKKVEDKKEEEEEEVKPYISFTPVEPKMDETYEQALKLVKVAESELTDDSYNDASKLVDRVQDKEKQEILLKRLEQIKAGIETNKLIDELEEKINSAETKEDLENSKESRDKIEEAINNITNEDIKSRLKDRLTKLDKILNDNDAPKIYINDEEVNIESDEELVLGNESNLTVEDENKVTVRIRSVKEKEQEEENEEPDELENNDQIIDNELGEIPESDEVENNDQIIDNELGEIPEPDELEDNNEIDGEKADSDDLEEEFGEYITIDPNEEGIYVIDVEDGNYELSVMDAAKNEVVLRIIIDSEDPVITADVLLGSEINIQVEDFTFDYIELNNTTTGEVTEIDEIAIVLNSDYEDGEYIITAYDKAGNSSYVEVALDTQAPVILNVEDGGHYSGVVIPDVEDANLDQIILTFNGMEMEEFVLGDELAEEGTYTIKATDLALNESELITFVIDNTSPVINVVDPDKYTMEAGEEYTEKGYSALDDVEGDITDRVLVSYQIQDIDLNWIDLDIFNTRNVGTYRINYSVVDAALNEVSNSRIVEIVDTQAPTVILNGDAVIELNVGDTYTEYFATATDNSDEIDENLSPERIDYYTLEDNFIETVDSVDTSIEGRYNLIYSKTDASGNKSLELIRRVYVR